MQKLDKLSQVLTVWEIFGNTSAKLRVSCEFSSKIMPVCDHVRYSKQLLSCEASTTLSLSHSTQNL